MIVEDRAGADGAGGRVEPVVDEVHAPFMRETLFVGEAHEHRVFHLARAGSLALTRHRAVAQIGRLVAFEIDMNGVERYHGREQGRLRDHLTAADEIAGLHQRAAGTAVDRRTHLGVFEIEPGDHGGRLGGADIGRGLRIGGQALVELVRRDHAFLDQLPRARHLGAGQLGTGVRPCQIGLGAQQLGLVRALVDDEQHLALLDLFAFLETEPLDMAGHSRPDIHRVHRLDMAGELVPLRHLFDHHLGHTDGRRRGRRGLGVPGRLVAACGECPEEAHE